MVNKTEYASLDHLTSIKITGDDATEFLQGQLTNDINKLDSNWHYSGYCSPKGRLLALFQLWRTNDAIYALTESSITEAVIKRLRMYVMRSKVTIEVLESSEVHGFKNIEALSEVAPELAIALNQDDTTMTSSSNTVAESFALAMPQNDARVMLINLVENRAAKMSNNAPVLTLSSEQWVANDIQNGLAQITEKSSELFIPQMLNLDIVGGISFKKGCYTGQEIVARMHYLGKLKQRMYVCELEATTALTDAYKRHSGDKVFADTELTKAVGHLVTSTENHSQVLAVLRLDAVSSQSKDEEDGVASRFFLETGEVITPLSVQPYEFPKQNK